MGPQRVTRKIGHQQRNNFPVLERLRRSYPLPYAWQETDKMPHRIALNYGLSFTTVLVLMLASSATAATDIAPIGAPAAVGNDFTSTVSDSGLGIDYDETLVLVLEGNHCIILLEKAAYDSFDGTEYIFTNPNGCWRPEDHITHAQLEYLLGHSTDHYQLPWSDPRCDPGARAESPRSPRSGF